MANLIDSTYFQYGTIPVPDLVSTGISSQAAALKLAKLERAIAVYEDKYLNILLGDTLYAEYKVGGVQWDALKAKLVNTDLKTSPIANYVFFYYWPDHCKVNMGIGTVVGAAEGGQVLDASVKTIPAWNEMVAMNIKVMEFLWSNRIDYEHDDIELPYCNWNELTETVWYF